MAITKTRTSKRSGVTHSGSSGGFGEKKMQRQSTPLKMTREKKPLTKTSSTRNVAKHATITPRKEKY